MAKFKPARGRKPVTAASRANAIGCIAIIALALLLVSLSMYYTVSHS